MPDPNVLNPRPYSSTASADDTDKTCLIFNTGDRITAFPDPQVVLEAGVITLYRDYDETTFETDFDNGGTASNGVLTFTADYTFGELQDLVNGVDGWACVMNRALRTQLVYTHSGTIEHYILHAADSAGAIGCAGDDGSPLLYQTGTGEPTETVTVCVGLEDFSAAQGGSGPTRRMDANASRSWDRNDPINKGNNSAGAPDLDYGKPKVQTVDRKAWIDSFTAAVDTATATTLSLYAEKQDGTTRTILDAITGPTGAGAAVVRTFSPPLWGEKGERFILQMDDSSGNDLTGPNMTMTGGIAVAPY